MGTNGREIGPLSIAVSAELRAELARKGFTVRAFSAAFGLPLTTLHKTLRAERVVDVEDLYSICEPLGIDVADVVAAAERAMLRPLGKLTQLIPNVGGYLDDALHGLDTAAGTDETQADED